MAYLYIELGIDLELATLNVPQRLPTTHIEGMGNLWFYTEYTVYRYSENQVKIKYEVYYDRVENKNTKLTEEEQQVFLNMELKFGGGPIKTHWETVDLEPLTPPSGIHGNDMQTSMEGSKVEMNTKCIDPNHATAYAADDAMERRAVRWMNAHKDQIIAIYSDIAGVSEAVANGRELALLRQAGEAMDAVKAQSMIVNSSKYAQLQKEIASLQKSLDSLRQELLWVRAQAKLSGAAEASAEVSRVATSAELSIASRGAAIHSELVKTVDLATQELAKVANGTRIATEAEMSVVQTAKNATQRASSAENAAKSMGTAGKWLKRAGWFGIALQAGSVILNGVLMGTAEGEEAEKQAQEAFINSAGGFVFSLGLYVGAGAIGGPVGIAVGLCLAGIDVLLVLTTEKSLGDWLFTASKWFISGWNNHIESEFNCLQQGPGLCTYGPKY